MHDPATIPARTIVLGKLSSLWRTWATVIWTIALAALALAATQASWRFSGWPYNHELCAHFERVETFRRAYAVGDWFPLWTAFSNNGHGSPMPLLYHRLFNTVAGLFALLLRSTYLGVKVGVSLFMFVGAMGMDRAARRLGASRAIRLAAVALFVFAPYVMTDWLTRGSTAEFSALMLAPWLLDACVRSLRGEKVGVRLGLVVALMFYAHNVVCYFALLLPFAAAVIAIGTIRPASERLARVRIYLVAGLVFFVTAGPYVLAVVLTGRLFDLKSLNESWSPLKTMRPLSYYLVDPSFVWGHQWQGLSVEIGLPSVLATAALFLIMATARVRVDRRILGLFASTLAAFMFLQVPAARWIYLKVPGAFFLGFPWRLLAFIVPEVILLLTLLSAGLADAGLWRRRSALLVVGAAAVWQASRSFEAQDVQYARYGRDYIEEKVTDLLEVPTMGEYLPVGVVAAIHRTPLRRSSVAWTNCGAVKTGGTDPGSGTHLREFVVTATSQLGCTVRLNQFFSPFLRVDGAPSRPSDTPEQTIEIAMPAGTHTATVSPRGLWALIIAAIRWREPSPPGLPRDS